MSAWLLPLILTTTAQAHPGRGETPSDCGECHEAEHREWLGSRHAVARTNEVFSASFDNFPHPWCLTCHQPEGVAESGVGCASCHPASGSKTGPELCATCHEFPFQLHTPASPFTLGTSPAQETITEWQSSTAALAGTTCTDCHMGEAGHSFPGAHTPELVRDLLEVSVVATSEKHVRATVSAPGAAHRVPTGDPFRRIELRLCADSKCADVIASKSLRRVITRDDTTWHISEDRTVPPETPTTPATRVLEFSVDAQPIWWQLDYRFGDRRFEPNLPEHAVGYRIAAGPVETQ